MYHISQDKRAQRSAEAIGEGMLQCLCTKPFPEITVTDIQKAAGVGRATFYRLFENAADVLDYLCDEMFRKTERELEQAKGADEMMLRFVQVWMENRPLLQAILDAGRLDCLNRAHQKHLKGRSDLFPEAIWQDATQMDYCITTLTSCIAGFLTAWVREGGTEDASQVQKRIKLCFSMLGELANSVQKGKRNFC